MQPTLDISNFNLVCALLGGFVLVFGLVSFLVKERLFVGEPLVSLLFGVAFGPKGASLIRPDEYGSSVDAITHAFVRIVLGVQLVLAGVELPSKYLLKTWKSLALLLVPVMTFMWVISSALIYGFVPGLNFIDALAIGACVTATDPVLSNSIVAGRYSQEVIPPKLRNIIIAESGANDGFAYPFLFLAVYLIKYSAAYAIGQWFLMTWLYEICLSVVYGFVVGWLAKEALKFAKERKQWVDHQSFLIFSIVLALFILGTAGMFGSDDILACFIAGNSFTWDDWFRMKTESEHLQHAIDMLLNIAVFTWFGSIMPWSDFNNPALDLSWWRLVLLAVCILIFRRLPIILAFKPLLSQLTTWQEALFAGYFGPVGVAAIYYVQIVQDQFADSDQPAVLTRLATLTKPIIFFIVLSHIIVFGLSVPFIQLGKTLPRTLSDFASSMSRANSTLSTSSRLPGLGPLVPRRSTEDEASTAPAIRFAELPR